MKVRWMKGEELSVICIKVVVERKERDKSAEGSGVHCWLDGRKGIRPVKKLSGGVLVWLSV